MTVGASVRRCHALCMRSAYGNRGRDSMEGVKQARYYMVTRSLYLRLAKMVIHPVARILKSSYNESYSGNHDQLTMIFHVGPLRIPSFGFRIRRQKQISSFVSASEVLVSVDCKHQSAGAGDLLTF